MHPCLQLNKMARVSQKELETMNWLPIKERFNQWIHSIVFKTLIRNVPLFE